MPKKTRTESYIANQYETASLSDLDPGFKGMWVKLKKPLLMTRAEYEEVWAGDRGDEEPRDVITNRLSAHIVEWNLIDYEGEPLPLPSEDETALDRIPWAIVEFLATKVMLLHTQSVDSLRLALGLGNDDLQDQDSKTESREEKETTQAQTTESQTSQESSPSTSGTST